MPIRIGASGRSRAEFGVAHDRGREAEMDRVEDRVGEIGPVPCASMASTARQQRGHVALRRRHQDRRRRSPSSAIARLRSLRLEQEVGAGARRARRSSSSLAESTLTRNSLALQRRDRVSSRCGNSVSGMQPRSITSAPSARELRALRHDLVDEQRRWRRRSRRRSGSRGATGRARARRGRRTAAGRRARPDRARTARRSAALSRSRSPRNRPGRMARPASSGSFSRRSRISVVISAATLTPTLTTTGSSASPRSSSASRASLGSASEPVISATFSALTRRVAAGRRGRRRAPRDGPAR